MLFRDLAEKERMEHLQRVLDQLSPKERELWDLMLRYSSALDIARQLGISHALARKRCQRLRDAIRAALQEAMRSGRMPGPDDDGAKTPSEND